MTTSANTKLNEYCRARELARLLPERARVNKGGT